MKKRHKILFEILRYPVILFLKLKFGYRYQKLKELPENYIVLSNHTTDYDPLLVALSFPRQMYFVASEHITRWGWLYRVIDWIFEPIIRSKGTIAASTVMDILRKVRKGQSVCVFAEGARTWDGVTRPIHPSTAKLVKASRCALITYRLEGGYFTSPRWSSSKNTRRGRLYGAPVGVYTKEQLAAMSEEEIAALIATDLHEDAYERQAKAPERYKGRRLAEGMERLLFVCPGCNAHASYTSKNDTVTCTACGDAFRYDEYGMLVGGRFGTVRGHAVWQQEVLKKDVSEGRIYHAETATLSVIAKHVATEAARGELTVSPEALTCGEKSFALSQIQDMEMHGNNALVFLADGEYYELIPAANSNVIRFLLYYKVCREAAVNKT